VHAVHAWQAPGEAMVRRWAGGSDAESAAEGYARALRERHEAALRAAITAATAEGDGVEPRAEPVRGPAREAVPAAVERLGADCLVMGTLGRVGVPGLIIGNTAEDILSAVACPVVTVKPPGYETPVR
jgi:nucleotide-binding universal stress UspA family protein